MTPVPFVLRFLLYLDEDSHSHLLAELLRRAGIDVLRSTEAGMDSAKDEDQLAFASSTGRVIFTANAKDYAKLHRDYQNVGSSHSGVVIWARGRQPIPEQARRLVRLWESVSATEMRNRQEFLSQWGEDRRGLGTTASG